MAIGDPGGMDGVGNAGNGNSGEGPSRARSGPSDRGQLGRETRESRARSRGPGMPTGPRDRGLLGRQTREAQAQSRGFGLPSWLSFKNPLDDLGIGDVLTGVGLFTGNPAFAIAGFLADAAKNKGFEIGAGFEVDLSGIMGKDDDTATAATPSPTPSRPSRAPGTPSFLAGGPPDDTRGGEPSIQKPNLAPPGSPGVGKGTPIAPKTGLQDAQDFYNRIVRGESPGEQGHWLTRLQADIEASRQRQAQAAARMARV